MKMKVCLVLTCLVAVSRAESPVSRYLPPTQGSGFGGNFRSSSLASQSFGVPHGLSSSYDSLEAASKQSARNFQSAAFLPSFGAKPLSKFSSPSQTYLPSQRSVPSQEHGVNSLRSNQPHQEHGAPSHHHERFEHGNFGRNAESIIEQEPANYGFKYSVNDEFHGTESGHTENRHDEKAQGQYQVLLPDGRKQTIEYEADEAGLKPHISYTGSQDASARSGDGSGHAGYDDNAQNLFRSHHSKKSGKDILSGVYH